MADQEEIPRAEQEAAMDDAPGYGTALLATVVIVAVAAVVCGLLWLLMLVINPIDVREGAKREKPPMQVPFGQPQAQPDATPAK